MDVDVVCLAKTSNSKLWGITSTAINMLHDSEKEYKFKVHLVESETMPYSDFNKIANYIKPAEAFNYNRFINMCKSYITNDWIVIMNSDLRFERGWFSKIVEVFNKRPDIESFSPKCPVLYAKYFGDHFVGEGEDYHENYKVTEFLAGWCYVMRKTAFDSVYPWDEQFDLYYQDNDYAEKIKTLGIKHALVRDSIVSHLGSETIGIPDTDKVKEGELKFRKKWNIWEE